MKNNLSCHVPMGGHILIPRETIKMHLERTIAPLSELEAWLTLLVSVHPQETICLIGGLPFVCARGESVCSIAHWTDAFHWTTAKTRRYLRKLQRQGMILLFPNPKTTHLRIVDYERWTAGHSGKKR